MGLGDRAKDDWVIGGYLAKDDWVIGGYLGQDLTDFVRTVRHRHAAWVKKVGERHSGDGLLFDAL